MKINPCKILWSKKKIDEEKMTDKISIVKETVIVNDLDKRASDRSNTIEIEKVQ